MFGLIKRNNVIDLGAKLIKNHLKLGILAKCLQNLVVAPNGLTIFRINGVAQTIADKVKAK